MDADNEHDWLAEKFQAQRDHLRGVAFRMLGSLPEADDAVQEAWLRVSRADTSNVENLGGWLTTVVARVSLDMLRSRNSRREDSLSAPSPAPPTQIAASTDPEHEAVLAESVGLALLVVLERLNPAERLAFVLHDMFAVSFDEIGAIVGRTPAAARQLASRARRRVQGAKTSAPNADLAGRRRLVDAFVAALRSGDFEGLMAVLDPDVVVRTDRVGAAAGAPTETRGARAWASQAVMFAKLAQSVRSALVDGDAGAVWAPGGKLVRVLRFTFGNGRITEVDIITDRARVDALDLAVPDPDPAP